LTAYPVNGSSLGTAVTSNIPQNVGHCGGAISVSSNGSDPATGVLWVTHPTGTGDGNTQTVPGTLRAVNATNLTQELWNSDNNSMDQLGYLAKWNCVTISNGRVYAPTFSNTLNVYGILADNSRCVNNVALTGTASSNVPDDPLNPPAGAIDGNPLPPNNNTITTWKGVGTATPANPTWLRVDLGARYDICRVEILWNKLDASVNYYDYAVDFTVDISDDGTNWTTMNTVTGNSFAAAPLLNSYNENSTGRYVRVNITQQGTSFPVIQEFRIFGQVTNSCTPPNLAGLAVTNITQGSATLNWTRVPGINTYIVKYKPGTISSYITRNVNDATSNPLTLNIDALSCTANYTFQVQADCGGGSVSNPVVAPSFSTLTCTNPCTNLTRFSSGDMGDIKTAGSTCYNAGVWTIQGEGTGIGGTADVFQINDASLSIDEEYIVRVASQDNINGQNQAMIMMREDLTDVGRYMAVGKLGNGDVVMIYRNAVGAAAVTLTVTNPGMNYFRIVKTGSQYASFYGPAVTGPWTQAGATEDLGFGATGSINIAMGVSSKQTGTLSTATFDNLTENSTILPVELKNFTATNISNQYVALAWQTTSEENTDRFEIERSENGAPFEKIMTVAAAGNSSTLLSYSAKDVNPINGIDFYRLKQIDLDNKFAFSDTQKVKFGTDVAPVIYPNPTSGIFKAVPGSEPIMEIKIYDIQGRAVLFFAGNTILEDMRLNVSALPNAVYILKIKTQSKTYQYKLMKQ
jgi:F5/8 type C domain/Secretion system C-terminal sorting domain